VRVLHIVELNVAQACAFFDNLPPSRLHTLYVYLVEMSSEDEAAVVDSAVRFFADPVRSRSVKTTNPLFESPEAKFILCHTLVGSYDTVSVPEFRHTQMPNLSVIDMGECDNFRQNNVVQRPEWMRHSRFSRHEEAMEWFERRNQAVCKSTRQEALALLCAARIIGCRARFLGKAPGVFPFLQLPNKLRIHVLSMLAPHLDDTQKTAVLSWACCAVTIGFCCKQRTDPRPPLAPTLDVPLWDWDKWSTCEPHFVPELYSRNIGNKNMLAPSVDTFPFFESTGTNVPSIDSW